MAETQQSQTQPFEFGGINHLALVCRDMERTVDFYTNVLGHAAGQDHRAAGRHGPALLLRLRRRRLPGLLLVPRRAGGRSRRLSATRAPRPGRPDQRHRLDEPRRVRRRRRRRSRSTATASWPPGSTAPRSPTTTTASGASAKSCTRASTCARLLPGPGRDPARVRLLDARVRRGRRLAPAGHRARPGRLNATTSSSGNTALTHRLGGHAKILGWTDPTKHRTGCCATTSDASARSSATPCVDRRVRSSSSSSSRCAAPRSGSAPARSRPAS